MSSPADEPPPPGDAAFTLTEMAASLIVATMLVSGLGEITRQFARTTVAVRERVEATRDARLAQAEASLVERADLGALRVSAGGADADVGGRRVRLELSGSESGERHLTWTRGDVDAAARAVAVDEAARFELGADGALRLWSSPEEPPLVVVMPRREAPFDCRYDVVVRACR